MLVETPCKVAHSSVEPLVLVKSRLQQFDSHNAENISQGAESGSCAFILFEPIVDKIIDFVSSAHVKATLRSVNPTFDAIIKRKVAFSPFLSDYTLKTVLKLGRFHLVRELLIRDLHADMRLYLTGDSKFDFRYAGVTSLSFHPGVPSYNKDTLICCFLNIEELRFIGSTSFPLQIPFDRFLAMKKLDIFADGLNDDGSLEEFLEKAKFPALKELYLDLYVRTSYLLYFKAHYCIANHSETLVTLSLKFTAKHCYVLPEAASVEHLLLTYIPTVEEIEELATGIQRLNLENLTIEFLPYEGTSLFTISFALALCQRKLRFIRFRKDYTSSRHEIFPLTQILLLNQSTLYEANLPHPYTFDCDWVQGSGLKTLTIGDKSFHNLQMMFAESDMLNISSLPLQIQIFRCSIRITKEQVNWIVQNLQLTDFYFYGHQADKYSFEEIMFILKYQSKLHYFGCNAGMDVDQYNMMEEYMHHTKTILVQDMVFGHEEFFVALGDSRVKMSLIFNPPLSRV